MLSDFDSDLTELSSDEEEYVPASQKRKAPPKKNEYKIQSALRPPRTTQYTARSLYDQMHDNTIELDPEYQRDIVWPESKQVGLIDSVLRNYYIPPVIFAVNVSDDGTENRVCIDGKQRLTSIQKFMDGLICHKDTITNKRYWYKDGPGAKRTLLPKQYMQAFANKQIVCVEYDNLNDDQEREIFQRVQLGVALTPAERMQAITGPWPALIREIQTRVLGRDGFGDDLDWGRTRGRDFQCLASIVYLLHTHPNTKFPGTPTLDKWLQSTLPVPAKFRLDVLDSFRIFVALVKDKRYNTAFQQPTRVSPIEFTMTGILIHQSRTTLSMTQLSSAISKMRTDVRHLHTDIRANPKVTKTMFAFITKKLKTLDLKSDGKGDISAADTTPATAAPVKLQKRKRVESSDDEDDDVPLRKQPAPKSSTSRAPVAKVPENPKIRIPARKNSAAKQSPSSKTASSTAAAVSKTPAKQNPAFSSRPPKVASSSSLQASTSSSPRVPATTQPKAQAVSKKPTPISKAVSSPVVVPAGQKTPVSETKPKPPALPRKSSQSAVKASPSPSTPMPPPVQTPVAVKTEPVKHEPMADVRMTQDSSTTTMGSATQSPIDRLAPLRAAKANVGLNGKPRQTPVVTSGPLSPQPPPMAVLPPTGDIQNVLDGAPPLTTRQDRTQLPFINTNISRPPSQQWNGPRTAPPSFTPFTRPEGLEITQANVEEILRHHRLGASPSQPQANSPQQDWPKPIQISSPQVATPSPVTYSGYFAAGGLRQLHGPSPLSSPIVALPVQQQATQSPAAPPTIPTAGQGQPVGLRTTAPTPPRVLPPVVAPAPKATPQVQNQASAVVSPSQQPPSAMVPAPPQPLRSGETTPAPTGPASSSQVDGPTLPAPPPPRSAARPMLSPTLPPKPPVALPPHQPPSLAIMAKSVAAEPLRPPVSAVSPTADRRDEHAGGTYSRRGRELSGERDRERDREYDRERHRDRERDRGRDQGWGPRGHGWDREWERGRRGETEWNRG